MKPSNVDGKYGAPMGRPSYGDKSQPVKLHLAQLDMCANGDYDTGGAYWGCGQRIYIAWDDDGTVQWTFRAPNRNAALVELAKDYPLATFYRGAE